MPYREEINPLYSEPDVPWYNGSEREAVWAAGGNLDHIPEYDWQCPEE